MSPDDNEPDVAFECDVCENPIYVEEEYYNILGEYRICSKCIEEFKKTAWRFDE